MAIECTASNLATLSACFCGLNPAQREMVKTYLLAVAAGVEPDPAALTEAAACLCSLSAAEQKQVQTYLLCQIANNPSGAGIAAPVAAAATLVLETGFTANWAGMSNATGFFLDVATDAAFTSFVAGYQNLDVGNVTSQAVTGLTADTAYFYRVRAYDASATSSNSSTITTTTVAIPTTGMLLWLPADTITGLADTNALTVWTDQSGNGNDAIQGGPTRPVYRTNQINGLPAVQFVASSHDHLTLPEVFVGTETAAEMFIVVIIANDPPATDPTAGAWTICQGGAVGEKMFYPFTDGVIYDNFCTTARKTVGNPTPSLASWRLYNVSSAAGAWTAALDGTVIHTTGTNTFSTTVSDGRHIGASIADTVATSYLNGFIAEIILYGRVLTAPERTQVKAYIAAKYGLTIA